MSIPKSRSTWLLALILTVAGAVSCSGDTAGPGEPEEEGAETMTISAGKEVSLEYTLTLDDETVVESNVGGQPLTYTHGEGAIIPGLESALEGLVVGDSKDIVVDAADGYGPVRPEAVQEVPIENIPEDARHAGALLQGQSPDGGVFRARVTEVKDATALVDFNHPLAGQTLHFAVKVLDIQKAPAETELPVE